MGGDNDKQQRWKPPSNPDYVPPPLKVRPKFSLFAMLLDFIIPYCLILWVLHIKYDVFLSDNMLAIFIVYFVLRLKQVLLWAILLYQRLAPEDMRNACLFNPSCSEYMFLSIQKYGAFAGLIKGFNRLLRCRGTNNGDDFP